MSSIGLKPFAVNVKFSVKPDKRDDFLSLIKDIQKKTLPTEPAALQFVVGEDVNTPSTFYMHAQFVGEEGFKAHRDTPHSVKWQKFSSDALFSEGGGEPTFDFYFGTHKAEKIPIRSCFCVHVELCVKPELREEFLEVIRNHQKGSINTCISNNEEDGPLCLQYVYGESKDEPNKFIFHEAYTVTDAGGKKGFEAHCATALFEKWQEFMEIDPFTEAPVVNNFKTLQ